MSRRMATVESHPCCWECRDQEEAGGLLWSNPDFRDRFDAEPAFPLQIPVARPIPGDCTMNAPPKHASERPDPEFLRPGQARRQIGRGGQPASGAVPGLSEAGRRDARRQLPRPDPRRPGPARIARSDRLLPRGPVDVGQRDPDSPAPPTARRCPRAWPTTPTTRSSASWARAAWASSTWRRTR